MQISPTLKRAFTSTSQRNPNSTDLASVLKCNLCRQWCKHIFGHDNCTALSELIRHSLSWQARVVTGQSVSLRWHKFNEFYLCSTKFALQISYLFITTKWLSSGGQPVLTVINCVFQEIHKRMLAEAFSHYPMNNVNIKRLGFCP